MQRTENVELTVLCLIHQNDNYLLQNRLKEDWKGLTLPSEYVNAVMVDIVCCINHIHFICPLFVDFLKAFQSVYQFPYILCYNVLCDFVSLIFSLIRVCNTLWEDITQGK